MAGRWVLVITVFVVVLTSGCGDPATRPLLTPSPRVTTTSVPTTSPTALPLLEFDITGVNFFEDPVGSLRFLLEVRNTNDFDVEDVKATISLKGTEGEDVDCQSGYARLDVLRAGDTAPIMVVFFLRGPEFSTYEVEIRGQKADYLAGLLHQDLRVVDEVGRIGQWVPYEVLGQVYNDGGGDAESVTLIVTCHGIDGKVVAVGTGRPTERTIPAGGSSDFLVSMGAVAGDIASCRVQVEGLVSGYSD
jgi:hypothetical protein